MRLKGRRGGSPAAAPHAGAAFSKKAPRPKARRCFRRFVHSKRPGNLSGLPGFFTPPPAQNGRAGPSRQKALPPSLCRRAARSKAPPWRQRWRLWTETKTFCSRARWTPWRRLFWTPLQGLRKSPRPPPRPPRRRLPQTQGRRQTPKRAWQNKYAADKQGPMPGV